MRWNNKAKSMEGILQIPRSEIQSFKKAIANRSYCRQALPPQNICINEWDYYFFP